MSLILRRTLMLLVSFISLFFATYACPDINTNMFMINNTGRDLFINTEDHRYFDYVTPVDDASPTVGPWKLWKVGSSLVFSESFCFGVDCAAMWHIALPQPDLANQNLTDIPIVWKTETNGNMHGGNLSYYLRPCFGSGECNVELSNNGISINLFQNTYMYFESANIGEFLSVVP